MRKYCFTSPRDNKGQAILLVVITVAVTGLIVTHLLSIVNQARANLVKEEGATLALFAADAGVEKTLARIKSDIEWYEKIPFTNDGKFKEIFAVTELSDRVFYRVEGIKCNETVGTTMQLNSVGITTGENGETVARKTLRPVLAVFTVEDFLNGLSVLPVQTQNVDIPGGISVNGRLMVKGAVDLSTGTNVNGDVVASGKVSGTSSGNIIESYRYIPDFPDLDPEYYRRRAVINGECYYGDTSFFNQTIINDEGLQEETATFYSGFYYVEGDLSIAGDYYGNAVIFSTGDIHINGDLKPCFSAGGEPNFDAGDLTLVSMGDIYVHNCIIYACIVARGRIVYGDGAVINGSACAAGVRPEQGSAKLTLNYEPEILARPDYLKVQARVDRWRERYPVI